jgi:hypothetical protein
MVALRLGTLAVVMSCGNECAFFFLMKVSVHFYPLYVCTADGTLVAHEIYPHALSKQADVATHVATLDGVVLSLYGQFIL